MLEKTLAALALSSAALGAHAAWHTAGDALEGVGTMTLTTAYTGAGDPDRFFNLSGTPAAEIGVLESALGLPAYALDLPPHEYGTEGSVAWQDLAVAAGDALRFSWSFTTRENDFEDHAFVVLGDHVVTLATRTQAGSGTFEKIFASSGTVRLGIGVIDTVDYLGVSTLQVSGLALATAVPEPGTLAMWLAGVSLLGLSRRGSRAARRGPAPARRRTRS